MNNTDAKVSIIIPVYNQEKYLEDCCNSILKQSFTNYEVLLINDGSIDSSASICDKFVATDHRFKVFHKNNEGVSIARNIGIKKSIGKYIIFIDADDLWLDKRFLEKIVYIAEKTNADLVKGDYTPIDKDGNKLLWHKLPFEKSKWDGKEITLSIFFHEFINSDYFLWLYLIRSSIIKDNQLYLTPHRILFEDKEFLLKLFAYIQKPAYYHASFYGYRKMYGYTASSSKEEITKKINDLTEVVESLINYFTIYSQYNKINLYWHLLIKVIKEFYASIGSGGYGNPKLVLKKYNTIKVIDNYKYLFIEQLKKKPPTLTTKPFIYIKIHNFKLLIYKNLWKYNFLLKEALKRNDRKKLQR